MNIRPLALAVITAITGAVTGTVPDTMAASVSVSGDPLIEQEVVVTSTRSAYELDKSSVRVRVISAEQIQRSAAKSVEELLRGEGSLQVRDGIGNGRFVSLSARGVAGGQNTLVLVDGRRLNNSDLSDPDLTMVTLKDVARIEVLEGGGGVLFGDQAVGGVVNIITRQGGERGGQVELGAGSYDSTNAQVSYGSAVLDGAVDYRVSAKTESADGYRDGTDLDYTNVRGELGYRYDGGRAYIEAQSTDNDFLLPGSLSGNELVVDREQAGNSYNEYSIDGTIYRLGLDHEFSDQLKLLASFGDRNEDVVIDGQSLFYGSSHTEQEREVQTLDPRLVVALDQLRLTLGTDLEDYDYKLAVNSLFGLSTSEHGHKRRSEYVQGIYSIADNMQLTAGYRHARVDVDVDGGYFTASYGDSIDVKQVGFNWLVSDQLRLYVNRDETFRFPVADENVNFLGSVIALKPQEGVAWDLGMAWEGSGVAVDLVLFDHAIENEIGYDTTNFANVNFDDTKRRGVTLDVNWEATSSLAVGASLTSMDAQFDAGSLSGNRIPGVSEELGKVKVSYSVTDNLNLYAESVYTGALAVDMYANADEISSFTVYNLAASYSLDNLQFKARVNNIFGKEYSEFVSFYGVPAYYPSPEENATVSVVYSF